jgi:hypothetical protein
MSDSERGTLRPRTRAAALLAVLVLLGASSYLAGVRGLYSSSEQTMRQQLADPRSRAGAVSTFAANIANSIADGHTTIANATDDQTCPATYAARASSLITGLDASGAAGIMARAAQRLSEIGWQVEPASGRTPRASVQAHNRRGLELSVVEVLNAGSSSIQVSVSLPCPSTESTTTAPVPATRASPESSATGTPPPTGF